MTPLRLLAPLLLALAAGCSDSTGPEPALDAGFAEVAAGDEHTCAITTSGDTYCWGNASLARLGNLAGQDDCPAGACPAPVFIPLDMPLDGITAGTAHSCGLHDARVWCWGFDRFGQLGDDGTVLSRCADDPPFLCSLQPALAAIGVPVRRVSAGRMHTCALTDDGRALCWGWNIAGQLGRGTKDEDSGHPAPRAVAGDIRFIDLDTGFGHTCGIDVDGAAWCWGSNEVGRLGTGDLAERLTPARVAGDRIFTAIAAGGSFSCGITDTRAVYCWGWGWEGRLGTGDMWDRTEPAHTAMPQEVVAVSAGQHHACAISHTGTLYCWGANHNGQLGIAGGGYQTTPQPVPLPEPVVDVSAGFLHTCAITISSRLFCWGDNAWRQLGSGVEPLSATPLLVEL